MTNDIVQHLESDLGEIARGRGDAGEIQVVQFPDQPEKGVVTYTTLGLFYPATDESRQDRAPGAARLR